MTRRFFAVLFQSRLRETQTGFQGLTVAGSSGTRVYMSIGPPPADTVDTDGHAWDAVQFIDQNDLGLKLLMKDGSIRVIAAAS